MMHRLLPLALTLITVAACGPKRNPGAVAPAAGSQTVPVSIKFAAQVNGAAFDCNKSYADVGSTKAAYQPADFRLYVSQVRLVRAQGQEVTVQLINDDTWQRDGVALVDFEDKTGGCINGTPQTHLAVEGTAPDYADYAGLRFVMGLPFEVDHQDATAALPPFDQAGLFWNWQFGYKFLNIDGKVNAMLGHSVHIGSTGCTLSAPNTATDCSAPNAAEFTLAPFDSARQTVVADLGKLLAASDVTKMPMAMDMPAPAAMAADAPADPNAPMDPNKMSMPAGCMSEAKNAECAPVFKALGLPFGDAAADPNGQTFFSVQ